MRKFIATSLIASLITIHPISARATLSSIEQFKNPSLWISQYLCSSGAFSIDEARRFIFQLKHDVKTAYGIDIDLNTVIDEAIKSISQTEQFSEREILLAREFYAHLIAMEPEQTELFHSTIKEIRSCNALFRGNKKTQKHQNLKKELILPDDMAIGFVGILGGSLLCIIPFGFTQALGTSLIVGGVYAVMSAAKDGEKPYYIDTNTGNSIPRNNDDGGMGISVEF